MKPAPPAPRPRRRRRRGDEDRRQPPLRVDRDRRDVAGDVAGEAHRDRRRPERRAGARGRTSARGRTRRSRPFCGPPAAPAAAARASTTWIDDPGRPQSTNSVVCRASERSARPGRSRSSGPWTSERQHQSPAWVPSGAARPRTPACTGRPVTKLSRSRSAFGSTSSSGPSAGRPATTLTTRPTGMFWRGQAVGCRRPSGRCRRLRCGRSPGCRRCSSTCGSSPLALPARARRSRGRRRGRASSSWSTWSTSCVGRRRRRSSVGTVVDVVVVVVVDDSGGVDVGRRRTAGRIAPGTVVGRWSSSSSAAEAPRRPPSPATAYRGSVTSITNARSGSRRRGDLADEPGVVDDRHADLDPVVASPGRSRSPGRCCVGAAADDLRDDGRVVAQRRQVVEARAARWFSQRSRAWAATWSAALGVDLLAGGARSPRSRSS